LLFVEFIVSFVNVADTEGALLLYCELENSGARARFAGFVPLDV